MVVSVDLSVFGLEAGVAIIATEAFIVSFSAYTKIRINIVRRKGNGRKRTKSGKSVSRMWRFCVILVWRIVVLVRDKVLCGSCYVCFCRCG